jgi:hypothetical protein
VTKIPSRAFAIVAIVMCAGAVWADWSYVPPPKRVATSTLIFIGTASSVRDESAGGLNWHVAEVSVDQVLVGSVPTQKVAVKTIDPTSLECAPNEGLRSIEGRKQLWTFYKNTPPLEFTSTDGPLVDLSDSKARKSVANELEAALAGRSKFTTAERDRLKVVISELRRPR